MASSAADAAPEQQRLQERIRVLEKQLEEKDDQYFELSATMATIQAETSFEIKRMSKETSLQLNHSKEELRRARLEANQAHLALSQLRQPASRPPLSSTIAPRALSSASAKSRDIENKPPVTVFVTSTSPTASIVFHTGPELARHLLMHVHAEDSIHRLLEHAQHAPQLQDTDLVWQIMQASSHEGITTAKMWLQKALALSPMSRAMLRQACCANNKPFALRGGSRISCQTTDLRSIRGRPDLQSPTIDLHAISSSLMNPLWRPGTTPSDAAKSNPFDPLLCKEWMAEISSEPQDWRLISILMRDWSNEEEIAPWLPLVVTDLISKWEAFAQSHITTGPRRVHSTPPCSKQVMSKDVFIESLHLLSDVFRKPIIDRAGVAILLDLLEFEIFSKECDFNVILGILGFLSSVWEGDTTLLRTKMATTDEEMAQSGLGVAILVLTASQLRLEECTDKCMEEGMDGSAAEVAESKDCEMVRNNTIRLFHQVLRGRPAGICFSSLIDERRHDYLGVCSQILASHSVYPSIKTMARLQMDEIQADREDEEELKVKEKEKAMTISAKGG